MLSDAGFNRSGLRAILPGQEARDPLQYEIWVSLDTAQKMLNGRETIRWTNTSRDTVPISGSTFTGTPSRMKRAP